MRWLSYLREAANEENATMAEKLGITSSVAITTVKPSGTVSQLVDSASGIHPRHSEYYIRAIRQDNKDPVTQFLIAGGIPNEPDVMKPSDTTVFYFPVKSPEGATVRKDVTPRSHLALWNMYNQWWAEHQVSVTVSVADKEWVDTAAWVFDNFSELSGISFLPYDGGSYRQAPYQECTQQEYEELLAKMPESLDWSLLSLFETDDQTTGSHELACVGGACEVAL